MAVCGSNSSTKLLHAAIVSIAIIVAMFSMLMHGSDGEAMPGSARLATPFRSGTFTFWGNPNIPSSHSSQLDNCMTCNWKVSNDGLFLQQSDHTFLLRWTWPTIPDALTDAV
ncbi:unnamed protein product [Sphagnum tenellum]